MHQHPIILLDKQKKCLNLTKIGSLEKFLKLKQDRSFKASIFHIGVNIE